MAYLVRGRDRADEREMGTERVGDGREGKGIGRERSKLREKNLK